MKFNCKTDLQAHCLPETNRQFLEDDGRARRTRRLTPAKESIYMENKPKQDRSFMTQLATFIVDKRNLFFLLIVVLLIFSAFSRNFEDKAKTESKPSVAGLIRRGKTTPSVNRTPPAAADDLMV